LGSPTNARIAWATAQALPEAGARLAFAYQGEGLKENVERLTALQKQLRRMTLYVPDNLDTALNVRQRGFRRESDASDIKMQTHT